MSDPHVVICKEAVSLCAERNNYCKSVMDAKVFKSVFKKGICYVAVVKKDGTLSIFKIFPNGYMRKAIEIPPDAAEDYARIIMEAVAEARGEEGK